MTILHWENSQTKEEWIWTVNGGMQKTKYNEDDYLC